MKSYKVAWFINIEADSPQEAADVAYGIQQDPESIATVFTVIDTDTDTAICWDVAEKVELPSDYPHLFGRVVE